MTFPFGDSHDLMVEESPVPPPADGSLKVLMSPLNICGQATTIASALRDQGVYARVFQYTKNAHEYPGDLTLAPARLEGGGIHNQMVAAVDHFLNQDFDILHTWQKSLLFDVNWGRLAGMDLPLFKAGGKALIHRFTGWDLRRESDDMERNPYSAFRYGFTRRPALSEEQQQAWLAHVRSHASALIVVDHEMRQFAPEAHVIPRTLDCSKHEFREPENKKRLKLIHAPTDVVFKGSRFFRQAVETLKAEGLDFEYEEVFKLTNAELIRRTAEADLVLDQTHLGWYGVWAMEAMAVGTPVLTFMRDDLQKTAGVEVPVVNINVDNLVDKLRHAIKDHAYRVDVATRGRAYLEAEHDPHRAAADLKRIYEGVLADPKAIKPNQSARWLGAQLSKNADSQRLRVSSMLANERLALGVTATGASRLWPPSKIDRRGEDVAAVTQMVKAGEDRAVLLDSAGDVYDVTGSGEVTKLWHAEGRRLKICEIETPGPATVGLIDEQGSLWVPGSSGDGQQVRIWNAVPDERSSCVKVVSTSGPETFFSTEVGDLWSHDFNRDRSLMRVWSVDTRGPVASRVSEGLPSPFVIDGNGSAWALDSESGTPRVLWNGQNLPAACSLFKVDSDSTSIGMIDANGSVWTVDNDKGRRKSVLWNATVEGRFPVLEAQTIRAGQVAMRDERGSIWMHDSSQERPLSRLWNATAESRANAVRLCRLDRSSLYFEDVTGSLWEHRPGGERVMVRFWNGDSRNPPAGVERLSDAHCLVVDNSGDVWAFASGQRKPERIWSRLNADHPDMVGAVRLEGGQEPAIVFLDGQGAVWAHRS